MTTNQLPLEQELEDFVQLRLDEWLLENPEPEPIPDAPEMPESKFLPLSSGGFLVLEILNANGIRLHVSAPEHETRCIDVINKDLNDLVEQLLILQADMQEFNIWESQYKHPAKEMHLWRSQRGQLVSDARREFVRLKENGLSVSGETELDESINLIPEQD